MSMLQEAVVSCPYCGEVLEVLLDPQDTEQQYVEDCQVCCRPINFFVTQGLDDDLLVQVFSENEM